MPVTIHNPTASPRIIHDAMRRQIVILPGRSKENVHLPDASLTAVINLGLEVTDGNGVEVLTRPSAVQPIVATDLLPRKRPLVIIGMNGLGDNIHQRGPLRELMKEHEVWLETSHYLLYHDMIDEGLKVVFKPTSLHAQKRTIERERQLFARTVRPQPSAPRVKLWYLKPAIDKYGTILQAMYGNLSLPHAETDKFDFSLPIKPEWTAAAQALIAKWRPTKPLMVYRPVVYRPEWRAGEMRNPDTRAYTELFKAIRDRFFVVSIADLVQGVEWIVGEEADADVKLHAGELDFTTMAALFKEADIGFFNAGFGPVLAQAVGTPSIVIYGGRESYNSTDIAGAHLAPTLGINPIHRCDCHSDGCQKRCDKKVDLADAIARAVSFVDSLTSSPRPRQMALEAPPASVTHVPVPEPPPEPDRAVRAANGRYLVFATTYIDGPERAHLLDQWIELNKTLNPDCDLLIVDSLSPNLSEADLTGFVRGLGSHLMLKQFEDNIGHLSRRGRDGWGRAFTYGLQAAIDHDYAFVAHVEGDSLFRKPWGPIFEDMRKRNIKALSTPVRGMIRDMPGWVETGLMAFSVPYLKTSALATRYDWPHRSVHPTPEAVIRTLLGHDLTMATWKAWRGDKAQITHQNVVSLDLDWITHCGGDVWAYDRFFEEAMRFGASGPTRKEEETLAPGEPCTARSTVDEKKTQGNTPGPSHHVSQGLRLNFGCGENKLPGWKNTDIEVDISKPLPYPSNSADFVFAEHCVEHIPMPAAVAFFKEALRVLKPGGTVRIAVPSVEQVMERADDDYAKFTTKWQPNATRRGAMHNILFCHGHEAAWSGGLLRTLLYYAGFEDVALNHVGYSDIEALRGLEGHGRVIGDKFNIIETVVCEGTKPLQRVAIILGGAANVQTEAVRALAMVAEAGSEATFFAINDMIPAFQGPIVAVTLHPTKLPDWLRDREGEGLPPPTQVWSHEQRDRRSGLFAKAPYVTDVAPDWSGSSGLFAVSVARRLKFEKIILCGVPMDKDAGHFKRQKPWHDVMQFTRAWERYQKEIAPYVRSMSGWTQKMFGNPSVEFITS